MEYEYWYERAVPLLEFVGANEGAGDAITLQYIADDLSLDLRQTDTELRRLLDGGYVTANLVEVAESSHALAAIGPRLTTKGCRVVGRYPPEDAVAALQVALDRLLESETDSNKRTAIMKFKSFLGDVGSNLIASAFVEVAKAGLP